jgi:hypothetical protein
VTHVVAIVGWALGSAVIDFDVIFHGPVVDAAVDSGDAFVIFAAFANPSERVDTSTFDGTLKLAGGTSITVVLEQRVARKLGPVEQVQIGRNTAIDNRCTVTGIGRKGTVVVGNLGVNHRQVLLLFKADIFQAFLGMAKREIGGVLVAADKNSAANIAGEGLEGMVEAKDVRDDGEQVGRALEDERVPFGIIGGQNNIDMVVNIHGENVRIECGHGGKGRGQKGQEREAIQRWGNAGLKGKPEPIDRFPICEKRERWIIVETGIVVHVYSERPHTAQCPKLFSNFSEGNFKI